MSSTPKRPKPDFLLRGVTSDISLGESEEYVCRPCFTRINSCLKGNTLTVCTIIGVITGTVLGFTLRLCKEDGWSNRDIMYVEFIGMLFLRMLKCMILPLVVSSLISAIGSLDITLSGKIGMRSLVFYMITTVLAVILGIILVVTIHPGTLGTGKSEKKDAAIAITTDTLMDLIRNMFPPNVVEATIFQFKTALVQPDNDPNANKYTWTTKNSAIQSMNILGLVVFSIVLGGTLGMMQQKGQPLLKFFTCLSEAMMCITGWIVWLSPIGVMFLIAGKLLTKEDLGEIIGKLGLYFLTVLCGILIHGFLVVPTIYWFITRKSPVKFILKMSQPLMTAFGTSSSSATLPVTIACLEDNLGIDPRVARFVPPIGATINMDGTALYEAVAAIFIAQVRNFHLTFTEIVTISITATAASIGAAGIPQAGLVTMVMVLDTVGLPAEDVSLILAVDWLLDRFRTVINVLGDSFGAGIVDYMSKMDLEQLPINPGMSSRAGSIHMSHKRPRGQIVPKENQ